MWRLFTKAVGMLGHRTAGTLGRLEAAAPFEGSRGHPACAGQCPHFESRQCVALDPKVLCFPICCTATDTVFDLVYLGARCYRGSTVVWWNGRKAHSI